MLRTRYTMAFAKFGKSGLASGVLNSAMSVSFVIASYIVPLLIENLGWHIAIFMWAMFIVVAVVMLLISNINYKRMMNQLNIEDTKTETA